jgi:hypothetical protein
MRAECRWLSRLAALVLPVALALGAATAGADTVAQPAAAQHGETGDTAAPGRAAAQEETATRTEGRRDLTVFFVIGGVLNVVMLTAFLVWAAGQWRRTK